MYINPIGWPTIITMLLFCVPFIVYAMRYGKVISRYDSMQGGRIDPYHVNCFKFWGRGSQNKTANSKWDKLLKHDYRAFGLYKDKKEIHAFQKKAIEYRKTHWNSIPYLPNEDWLHGLFNVAAFGIFAFPLGFAFIAEFMRPVHKHLQSSVISPELLAGLLLLPFIIHRIRMMKVVIEDDKKNGQNAEYDDIEYGNEEAWSCRGSILDKICQRYFDSEREVVEYANNHEEAEQNQLRAYLKYCKRHHNEWILAPEIHATTYAEGGRDRNALIATTAIGIIAFMLIILIYQISFIREILGIIFGGINDIINVPKHL